MIVTCNPRVLRARKKTRYQSRAIDRRDQMRKDDVGVSADIVKRNNSYESARNSFGHGRLWPVFDVARILFLLFFHAILQLGSVRGFKMTESTGTQIVPARCVTMICRNATYVL